MRIQLFEGDAGFEVLVCVGQRLELFVWRHHKFVGVALALTTLGVGNGLCVEARAVEIEVGVEMVAAEDVDQSGVVLRDMAVAEVFAHDGAVL